jgi:anti-sigma-K factor RskA
VNIKDYIASGIIESYVMGLASEPERAEFERMCAQYPELVAERRRFEDSLESYASEHSIQPPFEVKAKILAAIDELDRHPVSSSKPQPRAITMENSKSPRGVAMLRFAAAAALLLLVGMVVLYFRAKQQNEDLANSNKDLQKKVTQTNQVLQKVKDEQDSVVANPNTTVINMVGTKIAPKSSANVYWDSASSKVYLVVKNMPQLANERQYQLWALIDGKPKDLGVFDASQNNVILQMKNTQKAQAFAITIEKKGGVRTPTLDSLQSQGKTQLTQ